MEGPVDCSTYTIVMSPRIVFDEIYVGKKKQIQKMIDMLEVPIRHSNDYEAVSKRPRVTPQMVSAQLSRIDRP